MKLSNKSTEEVCCSVCSKTIGYWSFVRHRAKPVLFCSKDCLADSLIRLKPINTENQSGKRLIEITKRQYDICELIKDGLTNKEIAEILGITRRTVEAHLTTLLTNLDLRNRTELAKTYTESHVLVMDKDGN